MSTSPSDRRRHDLLADAEVLRPQTPVGVTHELDLAAAYVHFLN